MKNECPACGAVYSVTAQHVGRRIACKKCGAALVVEADGIELAGRPRSGEVPPTFAEGSAPPPQLPHFAPVIDNDAEPPPRYRARAQGSSTLVDYLLFRRMLTPTLIQVVFWVGLASIVITGIISLIGAVAAIRESPAVAIGLALYAVAQIVLGPIFLRVSCELVMVAFRIYETLREIKEAGVKISGER